MRGVFQTFLTILTFLFAVLINGMFGGSFNESFKISAFLVTFVVVIVLFFKFKSLLNQYKEQERERVYHEEDMAVLERLGIDSDEELKPGRYSVNTDSERGEDEQGRRGE